MKKPTKKRPQQKSPAKVDYVKYVGPAVFVIAVILNVNYSFTGITNDLLEKHSFRQTQTALTAYYFCKDGFKIAYETPVVGAPWVIPIEFPVFQWIVAFIKNITPYNLDVIGRVVSLLFFYLSLSYSYKVVFKYTKKFPQTLFILSFILLHPIYIFWSRTFMIESTALFCCIFYFYYSLEYLESRSPLWGMKGLYLILAVAGGLLAALVKITTLLAFCILLFVIILWRWYKVQRLNSALWGVRELILQGIFLFLLPFIAIKLWTDFADHLKSFNSYAYGFTASKNLNAWNFGTLEQRTSLRIWRGIFQKSQISSPLFYILTMGTLTWTVICKYRYWKESVISLALYLSVPLIFTNLHYIHDYYTYSNSIFLAVSLGFVCLSLTKQKSTILKAAGVVLAAGILFFFVGRYKDGYLNVQVLHPNNLTSNLISTANLVKENTEPGDVVMVYGNDWGSEYAYYTERRTIALRNMFKSVKDKSFQDLMKQNKDYNINTLIFVSYTGLFDKNFIEELVPYLGFKPRLQQEPFWVFQREKINSRGSQ